MNFKFWRLLPLSGPRPRNRILLQWGLRGSWAVLDQGFFALSTFLITVLAARWLSPEAFGAFALSYSVFLLLGTVHTSILTEPMLVFGSARYGAWFTDYTRILLQWHWLLSGVAGLTLVVIGAAFASFGARQVGAAMVGAGFATPFVLCCWLLRRACFACFRPQLAAAASAFNLGLMVSSTWIVYVTGALTPATVFLLMGGCNAVAAILIWLWLLRRSTGDSPEMSRRALFAEHWLYGRWALASNALTWVQSNVYYIALPIVSGLAASASLKAGMNIIVPALHLNVALAGLLVPSLVRRRGQAGFAGLVLWSAALCGIMACVYYAGIIIFERPITSWLYAGRYTEIGSLTVVLGLLPASAGLAAVFSSAIRALEHPEDIFWAALASAICALALGLAAAWRWGAEGAAIGMLASSVIGTSLLVFFFIRHEKDFSETRFMAPHSFYRPTSRT